MKSFANVRPRVPEISGVGPIWWHHHGMKMHLVWFDKNKRKLMIIGSAAEVTIQPFLSNTKMGWSVRWKVIQNVPSDEISYGRRTFSGEELAAAFGLTEDSGNYGEWLISRFGADSAEQGKYIRWHEFLNIPCPGTGHDGDPNVSIEIDEEIQKAIKELLAG